MPSTAKVALALLLVLPWLAVGCGGSKSTSGARPPATTAAGPRDRWGTVWLCRPGEADDPCLGSLTATVVERNGATRVERASPAERPSVDCFYVYPTVSDQASVNATLRIGLRETEVAIAQAARFSQVCSVYAPAYRQITLDALAHPSRIGKANALLAYGSVLSAFRDYLAHDNRGRGIVFIGHSQGAAILIRLLQREIDPNRALRARLVSALLLGGNVTVPRNRAVGGDFAHIPACTSAAATGCVVAYSSFTGTPPANSQFGRTSSDAGVPLLTPHRRSPALRIMCVNPASPAGGSAPLDPYLPSPALAFLPAAGTLAVKTPWVAFPGEYVARCESSGDATWLQITRSSSTDERPALTRVEEPVLGLHVLDVNIALGNLVRLVRSQVAAYGRR